MATEQTPLLISRVTPWINPYEYILNTNKGDFIYVPQDIVNKGYVKEENAGFIQNADGTFGIKKENRQYFHPELLKQDLLSAAGRTKIDENLFTDAQKSEMSNLVGGDINTGYLFPASQYMGTVSTTPYYYTLDEDSPPISGVSSLSNQGVGGTAFDSGYKYILGTPTSNNFDFINPDASINTLTTTYTAPKKRGGILGSAARSIVGAIADIPYLPEIAAFATGSPVLYGSLKAAQTAAAGGDLEDTIKSGVVSGGTMYLGQQILGPGEAAAGGVEPGVGGLPSDYNVDPYGPGGEITPDTGGFPPNYNVEPYGPGGIVPPQPVDMGLGSGIKTTLPPLPDEGLLGTTTTPDYGLSPQTTPGVSGGQGLEPPTMPNVGGLGGAQGITVPVSGGTVGQLGTTPTGATPVLGDPGSFINDPNVLGTDVIAQGTPSSISLRDATRAARLANSLLNPAEAGGTGGGVAQDSAQQTMAGVDYSGLYNLLAQRALAGGLLGTRYQPQSINLASLLG
jgi:hypothetical protein